MDLQKLTQEMLQNRLVLENLGDRIEDIRWIVQLIADKCKLDINKEYMLRHGEYKIPKDVIDEIRIEYKLHKCSKTVLADRYGITYYQLEDILEFV